MAEDNPNLIPPPSIGESKPVGEEVKMAGPKRSKLWLVVLLCVFAGVGMGVVVYQRSIAPTPVSTPRPVASIKPKTSAVPSPSPEIPNVSQVTPESNTIVFPKAGEVRVYFGAYSDNPTVEGQLIRITSSNGEADVTMPASVPAGAKMAYQDSGLEVSAGQSVTIKSFDRGNTARPSYGWIKPNASNKCGSDYATDAAPMVAWATQKSAGEPLVSVQCWSDWNQPNDTTPRKFNEFLIILSYVPASQASSPSPSASPSISPSPSPSHTASPSPSATATTTPSATATPTPTASTTTRVTMPEGSSLPSAGVFEVTAGTVGVGLVLILIGALGLLLI